MIGGGVIGLEMASVYQRFGSNVTVIEFFDEIVPSLDKELAKNFHKTLTKQGVKILTSYKVVSGQNHGTYGELVIEPVKGGDRQTLKGDHILVSTGRRPFTDKLGLDKAGVNVDEKGRVIVNERLETNIKSIMAIGDVVRGPMLAHKAEDEGIFAAEVLSGRHPHINYLAIPNVIYTYPEVACVGYTEEELKDKSKFTPIQTSTTPKESSPSWPTPEPRLSQTQMVWSRSSQKRRLTSSWAPTSWALVLEK